MTNGFYATFKGNAIYSGYTPRNNEEEFENKFKEIAKWIIHKGLVSATFKHESNIIEVSLINDSIHIDNVSDRFKGISI